MREKLFSEKLGNHKSSIIANITAYYKRGSHVGADRTYMNMVRSVMAHGTYRENRTDTDTISLFGSQWHYDAEYLPVLTTKKIHMKSVIGELVWFLRGETNAKWLQERGITIWDEWADADGNLGPVYGAQWRNFGAELAQDNQHNPVMDGGVDQIGVLIDNIIKNPNSRRHIVTAWNPLETDRCKLPPCHVMFQLNVNSDSGEMSLMLTQRSLDVFLGAPFNVFSYSLLLHMICHEVNQRIGNQKYFPKEFIHSVADTHIYVNHIEQAWEQWQRDSFVNKVWPDLTGFTLDDAKIENIAIRGYDGYHAAIPAPVAV